LNSSLEFFLWAFRFQHHPAPPFTPLLRKKNSKKSIEIDEKRLQKKVALIKTHYEEGRLQLTPAGHPQLATPLFLSPHDIMKKKIQKKS
jgi:hypothetical protein